MASLKDDVLAKLAHTVGTRRRAADVERKTLRYRGERR